MKTTKYVPKRYRKPPRLIIQTNIFKQHPVVLNFQFLNTKTQTCRYQRQQQYTDKFIATEEYSSA